MIYDLYKAMFYLEDLREILRKNTPFNLDEKDKKEFNKILKETIQTLDKLNLESIDDGSSIRYISDKIEIRTKRRRVYKHRPDTSRWSSYTRGTKSSYILWRWLLRL